MYIKRNAALWQVFYIGGTVSIYSSMRRQNCIDFVRDNSPKAE